MDDFAINRAFLQVVRCGSFSAAAREMNTSVTTVARQVSALENSLGVRLLHRTTRKQALTEAGQHYATRLSDFFRDFDNLQTEVASYQEGVKGLLKVHMRVSIGTEVIVPALPDFLAQHPDLTIEVTLTDERADLISMGIDVAVWLGDLADSSMIARRLTPSHRVVCASPDYLKRFGHPATPQDLRDHNCLVFKADRYDNVWRFRQGDTTLEVPVSGNLRTESSGALLASARAGLGFILVQERLVRPALDTGELVRVLSDYSISPTDVDAGIYAVYPHRRHIAPKSRVFIDFLIERFRQVA